MWFQISHRPLWAAKTPKHLGPPGNGQEHRSTLLCKGQPSASRRLHTPRAGYIDVRSTEPRNTIMGINSLDSPLMTSDEHQLNIHANTDKTHEHHWCRVAWSTIMHGFSHHPHLLLSMVVFDKVLHLTRHSVSATPEARFVERTRSEVE